MNIEYKRRIDIAVNAAEEFFDEVEKTGNLNLLDDNFDEIDELFLKAFDVGKDGSEEDVDFYDKYSTLLMHRLLFKIRGGMLEEAFGERKTLTKAELAIIHNGFTDIFEHVLEENNKNRAIHIEQKKRRIAEFNKEFEKLGYTIIQKDGCYIATAVYGSYDCPQVWILRRYRDNYLANHFLGKIFIRLYYSVSPHFVKWFGDKKWFNCLFHKPLDLFVNSLYRKGYADTPYQDLIK